MSEYFEKEHDFGFTVSDKQLETVVDWREAAVADGWEIRPTYSIEGIERAASLTKDGYKAMLLTRSHPPGGKWNHEADIHIWGPDGLAIRPPVPYSMERIEAGVRICSACGAENIDTQQYGFAGRCCSNCRPEMAKKHEYPGWNK